MCVRFLLAFLAIASFRIAKLTRSTPLIAGALERANLQPEQVNEVLLGNVLQAGLGQAPARQAALVRPQTWGD